ncbi:hypothetical protein M1M11_14780 [Pseudomonas azerbaijanoccidens]|jgi:hypothetical protein|uniref:Uncharacterized protein n=2 Tax=Pseudomonas TaxID=286 RepID=A0A5E7AYF0_PSEFL|nr:MULTISPECIES: hypothetical protein [Pseudomonas]MCK8666157.1 hypothetical protein [Pseudomonas azerbaijanoccidentalis]VVN83300.1 hypothetical protein PS712_01284 [Pseudomonas fluorescens]
MATNRQKSFIATLELDNQHVDFLGELHGAPAMRNETLYSGGFYTGAPTPRDDSHLLGRRALQDVQDAAPLTIYFRCTDDYYHLYIRSHATYTGHCVSKDFAGVLGAFLPAGSDTSSFNLLSLENRIITLENMGNDLQRVRLKTRHSKQIGGIRRRGAPYSYMAEVDDQGLVFKLRINERNASFLSDPDEI